MAPTRPKGFVQLVKHHLKWVWGRYKKLGLYGKLVIWLVILFYFAVGAFIIIITPARIAQFSYDKAKALSEIRYGWLILGLIIVLVSFPPLIGHTTLVTLCGFAYGMNGFFISATASVVGSAAAFVTLRYFFSGRIRQWSVHNKKWEALQSVVKAKGLPLIVLIRVSPLPPWVYSNSLFASIEVVSLWQFVFATLFIFPKLTLHTFVGSRMAALSDGDQRGRMDTHTKVLNGIFVAGGLFIAIFASWLIYYLIQGHIRKLEGFPPEVDELAAEAIEEYNEEAPLLGTDTNHT